MTRARLLILCSAAFALGIAACVIGPKQDDPLAGSTMGTDSGTGGLDSGEEDPATRDATSGGDTLAPNSETSVPADTGTADTGASDAASEAGDSGADADAVSDSSPDAPDGD